jgi:hypothetical protein
MKQLRSLPHILSTRFSHSGGIAVSSFLLWKRKWRPTLCPLHQYYGAQEGSKGQDVMGTLQLLDCFVKVDYAIQKGEDFRTERCHMSHCPVMSIDDGQQAVLPASVDQCPSHEG